MEIEGNIRNLKEENKSNIMLLIKKICMGIAEYQQNQKGKTENFVQRLLGILRKYGKELEGMDKLEEDLFVLANAPEIQKIMPYFNLLG